jgi:AcrR family transcriptional regulator
MTTAAVPPGRVGRPRAKDPATPSVLPARQQILDASAVLFAESGFAGTSTRAIAERVGIRQQSLYSHFGGKDDILAELLSDSVRPSIEFVESIESGIAGTISAAGALFALASVDARTLRQSPHNIGTLYFLPELQGPRFDGFRAQRTELRDAYGRLGRAAASRTVLDSLDEQRLGTVLIQLAELVIPLRREGIDDSADEAMIATSCLRVVGLTEGEILAAKAAAASVLESRNR